MQSTLNIVRENIGSTLFQTDKTETMDLFQRSLLNIYKLAEEQRIPRQSINTIIKNLQNSQKELFDE